MMLSWVRRGLRTGVLTTRYPAVDERMPEGFRGRPVLDASRCLADHGCTACVEVCLPDALSLREVADGTNGTGNGSIQLTLDYGRCIMCGLCVAACPDALRMTEDYELAARHRNDLRIINVLVPAASGDDTNSKEGNHD
jgi:formate hydrogenlyase subunit 6/NADH:ubiquinone oxidoreductase subunit I